MKLPIFVFILVLGTICGQSVTDSETVVESAIPKSVDNIIRSIEELVASGPNQKKFSQFMSLLEQLVQISGGPDLGSMLTRANTDFNNLINNIFPINPLFMLHGVPVLNVIVRMVETLVGIPIQAVLFIVTLMAGILRILVS